MSVCAAERGGAHLLVLICGLVAAFGSCSASAQLSRPDNLQAEPQDRAAVLTWRNYNAPSVRQQVRFGAGESPRFNAWADVPSSGSPHTVNGLANGTRYTFELRAIDDEGAGPTARASTTLAASPSSVVAVPDARLHQRIVIELARSDDRDAPITQGDLAKLTHLWANGVTNIAGLEFAVNLAQLTISGGTTDISPLSGLTTLTGLELYGNGISDISALSGLTSLEYLGLSSNAIADVSVLSALTSLEWLELRQNAIPDVSGLSGLTALTHLDLWDNEISNVTPLAALTSLHTLDLGKNEIADASPLDKLTTLERLVLPGNAPLTQVSFSNLALLKHLDLAHCSLRDVSLSGLTSLATIDFHGCDNLSRISLSGLTSLTYLFLNGKTISDLSLFGLTSLERLYLNNNALTDFSAFSGLTSLKWLLLSGNSVSDVSALSRITSLEGLYLGGNAISDISPLHRLTSLKELYLWGNRIPDVSALTSLKSLERLDLSYNEIADASPLFDLPSLGWLYLSNNRLEDASALSNLVSLRLLDLSGNEIADVSPLSTLAGLRWLDLSNNQIQDASALSGLTSLDYLSLRGNSLTAVLLSDLTSLTIFDVSNNPLVEVSMSGLTLLSSLHLANNAISSVSLSDLTSLFLLDLSNNEIADISMSGLTSLKSVDLSGNSLTDVSPLGDVVSLKWLYLGGNAITDISALSGLNALIWLTLWGNELTDISALAEVTSLAALSLSDNWISDVSPLAGLTSLELLELQNNQIVDLSPLGNLTSLEHLSLRGNKVTDISMLSSLTSLTHLSLTGNRLSDVSTLAHLTSLHSLHLSDTGMMDVWALSGLTDLHTLHLDSNAISDISALGALKSLATIFLNGNDVVDLRPLVESGMAGNPHAHIDLRGNPLNGGDDDSLRRLRAGGAAVLFDDGGHRVPLFPSATWGSSSKEGFVRVINHSNRAGRLTIEAVDEAGERKGPVSVSIDAGEALHVNAEDLEHGNGNRDLRGLGDPKGDWRLAVRSSLDIEVLGYARTPDGFVSSLHDMVTEAYGFSRVPTFNPGSDGYPVSRLRLINLSAWGRDVGGSAEDDNGNVAGWPARSAHGFALQRPIAVPAHRTLDFTAAQLESGEGLRGFRGIGSGFGKRRLGLEARDLGAMSLLQSAAGHLTNISTGTAVSAWDWQRYGAWAHGGRYRVPFFPAASGDVQGFLRIVNLSAAPTTITLRAFDGPGMAREHVSLTLRGYDALHLTAADLEQGNAGKGVWAIGAGSGDWHLEVSADRRFEVLTYAGTPDGFFTSLHDVAPSADDGSLWIPFFNPGSNRRQASRLRLVNWGETAAEVTITGVDDAGVSPGEAVRVTVPARSARDYMSWELEAGTGDGMSGALGDGVGKWRLRVSTTGDIEAMSLLHLPTGHIANVSTTPRYPPDLW